MGWLVAVVGFVVLLAVWVTWTATRLDRLHARVEAARASLDAQLVRRAAAALALADDDCPAVGRDRSERLRVAAYAALAAEPPDREVAENDLGRVLAALFGGAVTGGSVPASAGPGGSVPAAGHRVAELRQVATRVSFARRFYNDAVRDLRDLRGQRMPKLLRLGARRALPEFFEIDDRLWPEQPAAAVPWQRPA